MSAHTSIAAGWYDDPENPEGVRWWDGSVWTDHKQARPVLAAVPAPEAPAAVAVAPPAPVGPMAAPPPPGVEASGMDAVAPPPAPSPFIDPVLPSQMGQPPEPVVPDTQMPPAIGSSLWDGEADVTDPEEVVPVAGKPRSGLLANTRLLALLGVLVVVLVAGGAYMLLGRGGEEVPADEAALTTPTPADGAGAVDPATGQPVDPGAAPADPATKDPAAGATEKKADDAKSGAAKTDAKKGDTAKAGASQPDPAAAPAADPAAAPTAAPTGEAATTAVPAA